MELPDGDGLELLSYARARFPVQGISLSGHGGDIQERGAAVGFSAHLSKPFSVAILRGSHSECDDEQWKKRCSPPHRRCFGIASPSRTDRRFNDSPATTPVTSL
jgi:hypothetical protein